MPIPQLRIPTGRAPFESGGESEFGGNDEQQRLLEELLELLLIDPGLGGGMGGPGFPGPPPPSGPPFDQGGEGGVSGPPGVGGEITPGGPGPSPEDDGGEDPLMSMLRQLLIARQEQGAQRVTNPNLAQSMFARRIRANHLAFNGSPVNGPSVFSKKLGGALMPMSRSIKRQKKIGGPGPGPL